MASNLKTLIAEAEALKSVAEQAEWKSAELNKQFEAKLGEIDRAKVTQESVNKLEELKAWAGKSDGQNAVLNAYGRESVKTPWGTVGKEEGVIPGMIEDGFDLFAINAMGEQKAKVLFSPAYKDALNAYMRSAAKHGAGWLNHVGDYFKGDAMKILQEGQDTAGGFWVAPDIRADLVKKMATVPGVMNATFRFTAGSDLVTFPKVVYTTDDKYTSGVLPSWTAEAPSSNIPESTNPIAGKIEIPIHTLTAAVFLTRAQMEDAQFDQLGYVTQALGENIPLFVNNAIINGDGVGKPLGLLNHPNATVAAGSGGMLVLSGIAAKIAWGVETGLSSTNGLIGTEGALPPQYENNSRWFAQKATYAAVRALVDAQGRPLWQQSDGVFANFVRGYPPTLLGYPVEKDQFMPAIGATATPIAFGDFSGYYMPQRVGLSVEVFREVLGLRDIVVIYARMRLGGQLVHDWKVKLLKSNNA